MDCDRTGILPRGATCTGMCVNRQYEDINRAGAVHHCFVLRNTDYCTTSVYQAVQKD